MNTKKKLERPLKRWKDIAVSIIGLKRHNTGKDDDDDDDDHA
jgi:hypothetical protein